jgi:hypothetical protein
MNADPPPKERKIFHSGKMVLVSRAVLDGIRDMQRRRAPDLDLLLIAERQADRWLKLMVFEANSRARRKTLAR